MVRQSTETAAKMKLSIFAPWKVRWADSDGASCCFGSQLRPAVAGSALEFTYTV